MPTICTHDWSFLEGEKRHSHTLKAGRHLFPFQLQLGGSLPSSIATTTHGGVSQPWKVVVVDNHFACIGGLDLCLAAGTHNCLLADVHPTDFSLILFPGQDYNNARVLDFQDIGNYISNVVSILEAPWMP